VGGQHHAPAALPPEKDPVPIVQEAGWASGPKNLAPTGIRSPDRPALASRYTDWATRPTDKRNIGTKLKKKRWEARTKDRKENEIIQGDEVVY
jgi:hypothetical protein